MTDERFVFTGATKRKIAISAIVGVVLFILGVVLVNVGDHHDEGHADASHAVEATAAHADDHVEKASEHAEEAVEAAGDHGEEVHHAAYHWIQRVWANMWINNVYFTGIAIIGVFFFAIQFVAQAGWSAGILRVLMALGSWLPYAAVLMLVVFFLSNFTSEWHLFHWLDSSLYVEGGPNYDAIIAGKKGYLNLTFYLIRTVAYFALWIFLFRVDEKAEFTRRRKWRYRILAQNCKVRSHIYCDFRYHFFYFSLGLGIVN